MVSNDRPRKGQHWEVCQVAEATPTYRCRVQHKADIAGSNPAFPTTKEEYLDIVDIPIALRGQALKG